MQRDIAELFEATRTEDFYYREMQEPHRREGSIEKWPLLQATSLLLGKKTNVTPLASAARLFGEDRQ